MLQSNQYNTSTASSTNTSTKEFNMGKRNTKAKRSLGNLPKGLVRRNGSGSGSGGRGRGGNGGFDDVNPFEIATARGGGNQKRPKQQVHNRPISRPRSTEHALDSLRRRQSDLRSSLSTQKKANSFVDRRIGQYDSSMTTDDRMVARLVKERTRQQSKKSSKFRLDGGDDDDNDDKDDHGDQYGMLTHKGQKLDPSKSEVLYSDDDDDDDDKGQLEAADTELHFGGGSGMMRSSRAAVVNPYGRQPSDADNPRDLATVYGQHRKTELDDLIARRKAIKASKMATKETQVETFERMDDEFAAISGLLRYRKDEEKQQREQERRQQQQQLPGGAAAAAAAPTAEDLEMKEWNLAVREMMVRPKRQATDRTKTPNEIAQEESERLHKLETRRLSRMNGDFDDDDDFSDVSVGGRRDGSGRDSCRRRKQTPRPIVRNPDQLSDSDHDENDSDDDNGGLEMRFTADGIRYFDKDGNMVEKQEGQAKEEQASKGGRHHFEGSHEEEDDDDDDEGEPLTEGTRVQGHYKIDEQYNGQGEWYDGVIAKVNKRKQQQQQQRGDSNDDDDDDGTTMYYYTYDVEYDDGDYEENMSRKNIRVVVDDDKKKKKPSSSSSSASEERDVEERGGKGGHGINNEELQMKQKLAKERARYVSPYVCVCTHTYTIRGWMDGWMDAYDCVYG